MRTFKLTTVLIFSVWLTTFLSGFVSGKWEGALMISEVIFAVVIGYILVCEIIDNY